MSTPPSPTSAAPWPLSAAAKSCGMCPLRPSIAKLPACRKQCGDRAVLRAFHIYADNQRVARQVDALRDGDFETFLQLVNESGTQQLGIPAERHPRRVQGASGSGL